MNKWTVLLLLSLAGSAHSATTNTSLVTNPELRAAAGSMSKYSLRATLSYSGSSIGSPFEEKYRQVDKNSASENTTSMSGSLSARYRIDRARTINFGSGLRVVTPFHGAERVDLKDPYVSYGRVDRAGQLQYKTGVGVSGVSNDYYKKLGQAATASYSYGLKYYLGRSRFRLSMEGSVKWFIYDEEVATDKDNSDYYLGLYPGLDYKLTDRYTLKTSFSTSLSKLKRKSFHTWKNNIISQRVGVGVSVNPVIYVYPYLNFYPDRFTWETTTVSLSTTFSVF